VNGTDLFLIGRTLMKLGEQAIPAASGSTATLPSSVRTVLADVRAHPGSSIGEIAARTIAHSGR